MAAGLAAQLQDFLHPLACSQRRDGHNDFADAVTGGQFGNILNGAAHRDILDAKPLFAGRIVHQENRPAHAPRIAVADVHRIGAGFSRAHHHDRHGVCRAAGQTVLGQHAPEHARAAHSARANDGHQDEHAAKEPQPHELVKRKREAARDGAEHT